MRPGRCGSGRVPVTSAFWQDRPTLVTGATGLIGPWLVRRLVAMGADVLCLYRDGVPQSELVRGGLIDQVKVVRGDVADRRVLERALGEYEINTVIHLAAQTIVGIANRNPISTFESNIAGTWAVLEACRLSATVEQIVVASSDKAYGSHPDQTCSEDTPLQGRHPYDVSKSCADLIAQSYAVTYGMPIIISRCGNFYGGGDLNWSRIVPGTIRSVLRGRRPVIRSDGQSIREYIYVEDGAAAYTLLAERLAETPSLRGEAFNFCGEERLSVVELTRRIIELIGAEVEADIRNEATNEIPIQALSAEKARRILGWRALFTTDEGLQRTIRWYADFLGCPVPTAPRRAAVPA
jgi:CDP-glucose 4,6-dehydratase